VYIPTEEDELPAELKKLTIGLYGEKEDFYTLKGTVEGLLRKIHVKKYSFTAINDAPMFHPGRCASVNTDGIPVGIIGEIHPDIAENYGFETRVYIAVLDMNTMYENRSMDESYRPLPKYPAITRDIAVVCDEDIEVMKLENAISASVGDILERIELFDVYRGIQLGQGKKSVAFSLSFRSPERTLTDADADSAMKNALKALGEIGAVLRA
jgi:phenylalanyl-tRNA synthetase beta chain